MINRYMPRYINLNFDISLPYVMIIIEIYIAIMYMIHSLLSVMYILLDKDKI